MSILLPPIVVTIIIGTSHHQELHGRDIAVQSPSVNVILVHCVLLICHKYCYSLLPVNDVTEDQKWLQISIHFC